VAQTRLDKQHGEKRTLKRNFSHRSTHLMPEENKKSERRLSLILLGLTVLNCSFQIAWFWPFHVHNITMDAVNYIGLARHLLDGNFTASLHGYWSPLFSWMMAAGSWFTHDFTLLGHLLTAVSFLACLPLLYTLAFRLWHSHLTASFAVLWFATARGVVAGAVTMIQADFLFTACTLTYFILLIACLRQGTRLSWLLLGTAHAVAFLAKAFAMPWLAIATALAVLGSHRKSLRSTAASLLLAFLVPFIVWVSWGEALKTKYGVFTTGYQLRANLMVGLKRKLSHRLRGDPYEFVNTSYDKYMVAEASWPAVQEFRIMNPALVPVIFGNELRNIPAAVKETVILLSPGGVLGLMVGLALLTRNRASYAPEATFAWISAIGLASLVGAYGMLVFDSRYILPITAILMATASPFIVAGGDRQPDRLQAAPALRRVSLSLLLISTVFFTFYWASPFRTASRDYQMSCYHAAALLKTTQPTGESLVSIGNGPYPDHGIGFEAGVYVAYLTGRHLVAMNSALPEGNQANQLVAAVVSKKADAVLVWGQPNTRAYQAILDQLRNPQGDSSDQAILDPQMGEVGRVVFYSRR
jgi:4-amino-4-deoxy-L-arabinose transferase-like glycosyltransferase